ncbi:MCE family protein [Streptomyces sp. H10-C2]|uniref:MCE family protein n=1 Tax=unclassified Streptomyces TaxID=2593676 RepID=UPI0024B9BBA1|nr:MULTISPECIES: MCE family protein [unclassified Streptomyces]MDJ0340986.1 MCE family protein [Streptomyces sp. PH10-H1]MDJ0369782.1 MCE family protein [Streptomyces sp. H10-C2]
MRGPRTAALWVVAASVLMTGCEFNGLSDVQLPGGAAADGHAYHVTVEFTDVLDLVPQSAVKVNNVTVGAVEKVRLDGWHAQVLLRVADSVKLPGNAIAEVRQTSMLGEKYISLSAPPDVAPAGTLSDGATIPLSRSGRNPEIEEVLSALSALLNGGGVAQLHTITVELNKALEGREDRVKDLFKQLDTFVGGLDKQRAEIIRAMEGIDKLAKTLGAQSATIGQAVDTIPPALKVLAAQRPKLTLMLTALSKLGTVGTKVINASRDDTIAGLRQLQPILTRLNQAGDDLPNALELLTTYPFPRNVVDAIKGDYTNLDVTADLDLKSLYGNVAPGSPAPKPPGKPAPVPTLPGLPKPSGLPTIPKLPGLPDLPDPPTIPSGPSPPPGGTGVLCPPVCTSGYYASYSDGSGGGSGGGSDALSGIDLSLAALMTKGMQG